METSNFLVSYVTSIDYLSQSLDGDNDSPYYELHLEIENFYKIYDEALVVYEFLEKNSFPDDCSAINSTLLSKCKECLLLLDQYSKQDGQSLEGYKRIVSRSIINNNKSIVDKYIKNIEAAKERQNELCASISLLKKCEDKLVQCSLNETISDFISCRDYLKSIENTRTPSVEEYIKTISISRIKKTHDTLKTLWGGLNGFSKSLKDYHNNQTKLLEFLQTQKKNLSDSVNKIHSPKINNENLKYKNLLNQINDYLNNIQSFQYKTLNPNKEFLEEFNQKSIEKSIRKLVKDSIEQLELNQKAKFEQKRIISIVIPVVLIYIFFSVINSLFFKFALAVFAANLSIKLFPEKFQVFIWLASIWGTPFFIYYAISNTDFWYLVDVESWRLIYIIPIVFCGWALFAAFWMIFHSKITKYKNAS
jgi:hypothetical protein